MDIIQESLTTIVDRFRYETSVEHFVLHAGMNPPTDDAYKSVAPYFKEYGITPQDAFSVLINFDKEPSSLTQQGVESRVKMLNILLTMLNDSDTSALILQNYKKNFGRDMPDDQYKNAKGMMNLLKRLVKLLILEASQTKIINESYESYESVQSSNTMMIVIGVVVIVAAAILFMKKNNS
jgi:hypothetical protein